MGRPATVRRHLGRGAILLTIALFSGTGAAAQSTTGALEGTVVDEKSGLPVPGALVALDAGLRTTAAEDGRFTLENVRAGPYRVAAVAPGCHVGLAEVDVAGGKRIEVRLSIPLPPDASARLSRWTLGTRALGAAARTVTGDEIRRRNIQTIEDAIRRVAPDMIAAESGQAGGRSTLRQRGAPTVSGPRDPLVVVDGVRLLQRPMDALAAINTANVELVEVFRGATGGWRYGIQGANGVIRITTRNAMSGPGPETPPEQCRFTFPR